MAENKVMWRVGVDVGGTFTDLFGWNQKTALSEQIRLSGAGPFPSLRSTRFALTKPCHQANQSARHRGDA